MSKSKRRGTTIWLPNKSMREDLKAQCQPKETFAQMFRRRLLK